MVVPQLKCEFHDEYEKAIEEQKTIKSLYNNLDDIQKTRHSYKLAQFEQRLRKAKERSLKELASNKEIISKNMGKVVCYGMNVQLMHVDSEMFLSSVFECSEIDKIGYTVKLSRFASQNLIFQFLPRFKSRSAGDNIQYNDYLYIHSTSVLKNLSISDTKFEHPVDISAVDFDPLQ